MSDRSIWCNIWFKSNVSLLIIYLEDLSIAERRALKSALKSTMIIALLSVFHFRSVRIYLIYLGAAMLCAYIFAIVISSWWIDPFVIINWPLATVFGLKTIMSKYSYLCFFLVSTCMDYLFPVRHFEHICVLKAEWILGRQHTFGFFFF